MQLRHILIMSAIADEAILCEVELLYQQRHRQKYIAHEGGIISIHRAEVGIRRASAWRYSAATGVLMCCSKVRNCRFCRPVR